MPLARPLALLVTAALAVGCGADDEPAASKALPTTSTAADPQRVGVVAGAPAASVKIYCKGLGRKTVPEVRASAFSICMESIARVRSGRAKTSKAACRRLSRKRVKALRGSPRSICTKATKRFLRDRRKRGARDSDESATDEAPPEDEFVLDEDGEEVPLDDLDEADADAADEGDPGAEDDSP